MRCSACGGEIPEWAAVCGYCGTRVDLAPVARVPTGEVALPSIGGESAPPPWEEAPVPPRPVSVASRASSQRARWPGGLAVAGGMVMMISVFLPWWESSSYAETGWDEFLFMRDLGFSRAWFVQPVEVSGWWGLYFSALSVLIAGVLLSVIGGALVVRSRRNLAPWRVSGRLTLGLVAAVLVLVGIANLITALLIRLDVDFWLDPGFGMYVLAAGAMAGFLGVVLGLRRGA